MIQALHNGASGMLAQQKNIDTIANNIANINTTGYVKNRVDFKDAIYSTMVNPDDPNSTVNLQQGNGVLLSANSKIYSPSVYYDTENPLDLSISGEGFFVVQNQQGELSYTRDGSFQVSEENGNQFLVNAKGDYVLDKNMQKIQLYGSPNEITIDSKGLITFSADQVHSSQIGVVGFVNKGGLESAGNNLQMATIASGQPTAIDAPKIKQQSLEGSNVDLTDEMTQLIKAQRAYQIASKAVSTADEMEALSNNLRK